MAFSPCQITGFFRIHDRFKDARRIGSTGVGVCLEQGVSTRVIVKIGSYHRDSIKLNGRPFPRPVVSTIVLQKFLERFGPFQARVLHSTKLPIGCGYGTSGAGALSLAYAMNDALGRPLTNIEAAQVAHVAEVEAWTGLGTVASEHTGGVVVRLKPGAPGVGKTKRLGFRREIRLVSASFGPFRKNRVLGNQSLSRRVNMCGENLVTSFLRKPDNQRFFDLSRRFSDCLSLTSTRLDRAMRKVAASGFLSSMMMLGESLFLLVEEGLVGRASKALTLAGLRPVVSEIAYQGARLV